MDQEKKLSEVYNEGMKEITKALIDKTTDTTEARRMIENLINEVSRHYDLNSTIHSFDNPIEKILFDNFEEFLKTGKVLDVPVHYIYYFLGLAFLDDGIYDDAKINFEKALKINPFFAKAIFKIAECYRISNENDKMYEYLIKMHKYLYQASDLSDFYSRLGDSYYDVKNFSLANSLYSYSEYYKKTGYNQQQLANISRLEGRIIKLSSVEEIIPLLNTNNIPISISKKVLDLLVKIYMKDDKNSNNLAIKILAKKTLYDLTKNEIFAPSTYLRNDEIGFIFQIPEIWEVFNRSRYNNKSTDENTLFVIKPLSRVTINISNLGQIKENKLNKAYLSKKEEYLKDGYSIISESLMKTKNIEYIQFLLEKKILNDYVIDVHNFININNNLIDFMIPINDTSIRNSNILNDKNIVRINNVISTIQIIDKPKEEQTEEFVF